MRIAFILPSIGNYGPIVFTKYLIDSLVDSVDYIHVYYFDNVDNILDLGVDAFKINLFTRIDFDKYDIIHTTMMKPDIYAYIHRRYIKSKIVISMHNIIDDDLKYNYKPVRAFIMKYIWKFVISRPIPIIVSSSEMKNYYLRFTNGKPNLQEISYGISCKDYSEILDSDEKILKELQLKYKIIGSVGLVIKRKGFDQLIQLLNINKSVAVVIIGDGPDVARLKDLIDANQLNDRFFILGFRNDSWNYYKYFDIYAHVSYSEGFGLAMLEAMSHSLPVVCSDLPIYKDFFNSSKIGLFQPSDIKQLNEQIVKVLNNYNYYKESVAYLFNSEFSDVIMAKRHLDLYTKIKTNNTQV